MKVLKNSLEETDIVQCSRCGSRLEINYHDIFWTDFGMFSTRPAFKCPVCGTTLYYGGNKIKTRLY